MSCIFPGGPYWYPFVSTFAPAFAHSSCAGFSKPWRPVMWFQRVCLPWRTAVGSGWLWGDLGDLCWCGQDCEDTYVQVYGFLLVANFSRDKSLLYNFLNESQVINVPCCDFRSVYRGFWWGHHGGLKVGVTHCSCTVSERSWCWNRAWITEPDGLLFFPSEQSIYVDAA